MYYFFNRYLSLKTILLFASEAMLVFIATLLSVAIRFGFDWSMIIAYDPHFIKAIVITVVYLTSFYYFGIYAPDLFRPRLQMCTRLIQAIAIATVILFCIYFLLPEVKTLRGVLLINILVVSTLLLIWRMIFSRWLSSRFTKERVLIIGSGDLAKKIGSDIYHRRGYGLKLVGFIDDDPAKWGKSIVNPGVVGGYGDILRVTKAEGIDRIITALPDRRAKLPMTALLDCKLKGIGIEEGETFHERMTGRVPLDQLKPSWMVFSDGFKSLRSKKILKRVFDITFSALLLVLFFPVMLITTLVIKLDSKGPIIFKQPRVGENGKEFEIYKFRSMRQDAEAATGPVWAGSEDDRITRVGSIIRKLRIDEFPQLINVIKGDMSFVGPRPERAYFVDNLKAEIPYYEIRTVVKPGITGWAQVKYPYGATTEDALEKLQYDIYYIKNMSPLLDSMIVFWTIRTVLTGKGAR